MASTVETFEEDVTPNSTVASAESECLEERYWSFFLASSLIVLFSGLIVILTHRLVAHLLVLNCRRSKTPAELADEQVENVNPDFQTRLKWHAEGWISGQTTMGKVMVRQKCFQVKVVRDNYVFC